MTWALFSAFGALLRFGGRSLITALAASACAPALGDALDCSPLPRDMRPLCEALSACSAQPSAPARRACFDAASRQVPVGDGRAETPPALVAERADDEVAVPPSDGQGARARRPASAQASPAEKRRDWFRWLRRSRVQAPPAPQTPVATSPSRENPASPVVATSPTNPASAASRAAALAEDFSAVAQAVWPHGLDWQRVLLDNGLLLEGRSGPRSRIAAGDSVRVRVARTLAGERYRLTSPSRRTFDMVRLRCDPPGAADARKCAAARSKHPRAGW